MRLRRCSRRRSDSGTRFSKVRYGSGRSPVSTREKDEARAAAVKIYKRCVDLVRLKKDIDGATLIAANLRPHSDKRRARTCPQEPPVMRFSNALHAGAGAMPMHELTFHALHQWGVSKPAGATRLELFVDLIAPDEPVPRYPGANDGGRPWYLRSFSRTPIRIAPPICRVPMVVLYWGRWADATGNVGPFCQTVVSRIEGWSQHVIMHTPGSRNPNPVRAFDDPSRPGRGERKYSIEVLDAQYHALHAQAIAGPSARRGSWRARRREAA